MRRRSSSMRRAADLHLHHGVAAIEIAAHLGAQRRIILARIVIAARCIDEHARIGGDPVPLGQQPEQRLAGDLRHRVPHRHVDRADRHRAVAMPARLLVGHHAGPDAIRIEILPGRIQQRSRIGLQDARGEAFADQAALAVATIGIEPVADHAPPVALHIGHHRDQARCHLGEIDIRVADRRTDRLGDLTHVGDAHWHGRPLSASDLGYSDGMRCGVPARFRFTRPCTYGSPFLDAQPHPGAVSRTQTCSPVISVGTWVGSRWRR